MCAPPSAAESAADIPAGPPPTTSTSNRLVISLFIGPDIHARHAKNLTASLMRRSVDLNSAFITNPHSAQWPTWLAGNRVSAVHSGYGYCDGNGGATGDRNTAAVHPKGDP